MQGLEPRFDLTRFSFMQGMISLQACFQQGLGQINYFNVYCIIKVLDKCGVDTFHSSYD